MSEAPIDLDAEYPYERRLERDAKGLYLRLGNECNTPIYTLTNWAGALCFDKPRTWKGGRHGKGHRPPTWTFGLAEAESQDATLKGRLVIQPGFEWTDEHDIGWMPSDRYRLELVRWYPGPITFEGHDFPKGVGVHTRGQIENVYQSVRLTSGTSDRAEGDLLVVAEVIETLKADPEAVLRRRAHVWPHCCFCGRGLTDPDSRHRGYGPECAQQMRLAHGGAVRQMTPPSSSR